jgi:RimJ/RimL family protein N-acetyltransferase
MTDHPRIILPIRTQRLILRDFRVDDFEAAHAYASDPEVARFMRWGPNTEDDTHEAIARMMAWHEAQPQVEYGVAIFDPVTPGVEASPSRRRARSSMRLSASSACTG